MSGTKWWSTKMQDWAGPFDTQAELDAWTVANPSLLFVGLRATLPTGEVRWSGSGWITADVVTANASTTGSIAIESGSLIVFGTLTGAVTFTITRSDIETHFIFSTGATPPTVTWPAGITWAGAAPTLVANKKYEISILNNLAVFGQY